MTNLVIEPYIETVSGVKFEFLDPLPHMINIEDIAHALSMQCRYTGHTKWFYSVAEHAVWVSYLVPKHLMLEGLLHDASEAYIADIASPVKQYLSNYKEIEDKIMKAISEKYGVGHPLNPAVKQADLIMLSTEAYDLLPSQGASWEMWEYIKRPDYDDGYPVKGFAPEQAKELFLDRFKELYNDVDG